MSSGPLIEIAAECDRLIADGATIFQKWTCIHCGSRQTMPDPNVLYTSGQCDECKLLTDISVTGCGFMLIAGDPEMAGIVEQSIREAPSPRDN